MIDSYRDICEKLGWKFTFTDGEEDVVELEKYSPAGEDFIFYAGVKNFLGDVKSYAESFDPDEHVETWVVARHNGEQGIPPLQVLLSDAEAIDNMLQQLAEALGNADLEAECE